MMRIVLPALLVCLVAASGKVWASDSVYVHVTVEGLRSVDVSCRLLLFESRKGFPDSREKAAMMLSGPIRGQRADFTMRVRPGRYAIAVLHDENANERMDKTWYGRPKEGFGASNNPKVGFGPPGFEESAAVLDEKNNSLTITMTYL